MHIVTVIGARPQFIKAAVVSKAMAATEDLQETLIHTGQHFDVNMSDIFFKQLGIPQPDYLLDIHGGSHGAMTGRMLAEIEAVLLKEKPDRVLVYGDTNSTLAGALAAAKLHIPVAHIEAGLRSFNMQMPEEINRILTDHISDMLFCPTETAMQNLHNEGFGRKPVHCLNVGDVMQDAALFFAAHNRADTDCTNPLPENGFILATLHRAENTDQLNRLEHIIAALNHIHRHILPIILPVHPRTKALIERHRLQTSFRLIDPVGYLEMIRLLQNCRLVLTDSGGLQKEAFFFRKPCVTMRDETEWVELTEAGANRLAGADTDKIITAVAAMLPVTIDDPQQLYGGGHAAQRIIEHLSTHYR